MARRRFVADTSIGTMDMLFNLLLFFFMTTVLTARARSLADDVAVPGGDSKVVPVVVRLENAPSDTEPARFSLQSAGKQTQPPAGVSIPDWLKATCAPPAGADDKTARVVVQIECPDTATHAQCKQGVRELWMVAGQCNYQY